MYVGLLFSLGEVCVCGRVRTMRNVKGQKTKIRNVINGDDQQRRLININVDDRSAETRQYVLFEVFSEIFSLNWLKQHFSVWIYDTCVNQNSKLEETLSIMEEMWSNRQKLLTTRSWRKYYHYHQFSNVVKSSGITYNSKLEPPSKKSYWGIVNGHHLREDER